MFSKTKSEGKNRVAARAVAFAQSNVEKLKTYSKCGIFIVFEYCFVDIKGGRID